MWNFVKKAWHDPYTRNAAIFFCGSMFVAFLNYLRYPLFSRVLSIESFGEVQALFALFSEMAVVFSAFSLATIHLSANCDDGEECSRVVRLLRDVSLAVVFLLFFVFAIGAKSFAAALHFEEATPFVFVGVMLVMSALYSTRMGYVQGRGKFGHAFTANAIVAATGLLSVLAFSRIHGGTSGAVAGIVVGQVLGTAYLWWLTRKTLGNTAGQAFHLSRQRVKEELWHVFMTFIVMVAIALLYTADIVIVKRYFPATTAGYYGGVSTVGNIVMFASAPIISVLLPLVKRRHSVEVNRKALKKCLLTLLAVGGSVCLGFMVFPGFFVKLLIGAKYVSYAYLLRFLAPAFFLVALANAFTMYGLALRRYALTVAAACDIVLLFLLAAYRHGSLEEVVQNFLATGAFALVGAVAITWKELRPPVLE